MLISLNFTELNWDSMRNYCKLPVNHLTGAQAGNRSEVISGDFGVIERYCLMHFEELNCLFLKKYIYIYNPQTCIACQVAVFFKKSIEKVIFFFKVPIFSILCPSLGKWQITCQVIWGQSPLPLNQKNERIVPHGKLWSPRKNKQQTGCTEHAASLTFMYTNCSRTEQMK